MKIKRLTYPISLFLTLFLSFSIRAQHNQVDSLNSAPIISYGYDSVSVKQDSLRDEKGDLARQQFTTDYYKKINGVMTIVEKRVCLSQSWNSERIDCWIYHLKNGELVNDEYLQGAE